MGRTSRKLLSSVLILRPSLASTRPKSACTPNTRGGRTHEHLRTGGNSMRAVGTCCTRSCWRRPGRRRWTTGARDPRPSCPSGSERGPARSPETPSPLMMRMRDRLRLPRVLRKRKRRKRKRMRRRRKRRSKCGQIVRQEEPPIHLRNCSLSQLLHKRTAVDSCCTLQKQTLRPSREIFQLEFTNVSNLCSWDILRLVNKQIIFPFVRFDFTQSPNLMGCFPKLNKDGKLL